MCEVGRHAPGCRVPVTPDSQMSVTITQSDMYSSDVPPEELAAAVAAVLGLPPAYVTVSVHKHANAEVGCCDLSFAPPCTSPLRRRARTCAKRSIVLPVWAWASGPL